MYVAMCAAVLLGTLAASPADAAWWKTKTVWLCVDLVNIHAASPDIPESASAYLNACVHSVNDKVLDVSAYVQWFNEYGDFLTVQHYDLSVVTRDLVIRADLTRGVLHLPDGSAISWVGTANGDDGTFDYLTHRNGVTTRTQEQSHIRWAATTGTLAGTALDAPTPDGTRLLYKTVIYE
jgi:hypothetical protein